jgi:hypothetical protein
MYHPTVKPFDFMRTTSNDPVSYNFDIPARFPRISLSNETTRLSLFNETLFDGERESWKNESKT